ncbi:stress-related protein-like [Typha latifolia]|uniref:stress-related protein-like n=1 Tax=Typha latifolia TaxID=4733 RepID=UPI003C307D2E
MAESNSQSDQIIEEKAETRLRYLEFVQVAAMQAVVCFASVYDFAKQNSGPLKPGVETVESTVKAVIRPVYERFHDIPFELLNFVDRKVDESLREVGRYVPALMKSATSQAYVAAQCAPGVARSLAGEVQRSGVSGAAKAAYERCEPTAREMYDRYEPVAERHAVAAWRSLNRLPMFPQAAGIVVPTAAYCAEKYNCAVGSAAARGYHVAEYLPVVPTEKIAKVFRGDGEETTAAGNETKVNGDGVE